MKEIKLTEGKCAIVDEEDFEYLNQWKWHLSSSGYARRHKHIRLGVNQYTNEIVWMHRLINQTPNGLFTDHINQDKLDNRKSNLRNTNKSLNSLNRSGIKTNTSGVYGVHFEAWSKKWRAEIRVDGKRYSLGRFDNLKHAASARRMAESKLNFYAV